ncbi:MAG: N-acetylmuramoyl-L-alanine amidase [Deltaproteobacteria bacterium]|nr:N-acetylmuramoyl-L-alanine amidase [Deltaproteobacteria bacterium]
MATVDETKSRLMRGVVQANMEVLQGVKLRRIDRRRRFVLPWLFASLALASGTYFIRPGAWDAAHRAASANSDHALTNPMTAPIPALNIDQTPESAASLDNPRPIDRGAIPLSVRRIVIDPGHGGEPGALSESGVTEKEITLDIALRLRRLMAQEPFEVFLTRQTDRLVPLDKRVAFANENKADLFVSIHVNWMEPRTIRALETYYVGPSDDPATLKLAGRENKDSGYSLSDYKKILEKIYVDARHDESRVLAKTIQTQLYHTLKPANPAVENRGVKSAPFVVLIGTQMPAILAEIACLSNDDEALLLTKEAYRENIALALFQGIRAYARNLNGPGKKGN